MQQQQRWQRNTTSKATSILNGKTSETSGIYLPQHFSRTSSARKINTHSSFSKENVSRGIKTKCSSRTKDFPFRPILGKFTKDQEIVEIVKGYTIPLLRTTVQDKTPLNKPLKRKSELSSGKEIKEMLEKGAIKKLSQHIDAQNQFLSNFFLLVRKKDGGYRPVINLKTLNQFVSYMRFKMESLQTLKYMMKERDYICKTDLKALYLQYL